MSVRTNPQAQAQIPFAFAGRVSTEDQQDPESSYQWQIGRARSLIEPHGGVIVAEYFDIGHSRALPWHRRPQARQLLDALARPDRGFSAVVIGEPQRAFYDTSSPSPSPCSSTTVSPYGSQRSAAPSTQAAKPTT
jgi:hypothetical protein